ncbi:MAG TPA: class I SAM-dependent methyltransferase [Coleofasciculaceae cyanobacterium]
MNNSNRNQRISFDVFELLAKSFVKPLHYFAVSQRRAKRISHHLSSLLPCNQSCTGLDVGCGNGAIANNIQSICPHIKVTGVDVLVRRDAEIDVTEFDGKQLPFENKSYDFVVLVDVLHHTNNPAILLEECVRVSRQFILIKDHFCESSWDIARLRFMDWVGNRAYNVSLPYNYLKYGDWEKLYQTVNLVCEVKVSKLNLYPQPFSLLFDSSLHFIAKLAVPQDTKT